MQIRGQFLRDEIQGSRSDPAVLENFSVKKQVRYETYSQRFLNAMTVHSTPARLSVHIVEDSQNLQPKGSYQGRNEHAGSSERIPSKQVFAVLPHKGETQDLQQEKIERAPKVGTELSICEPLTSRVPKLAKSASKPCVSAHEKRTKLQG
jgi:hypothetical protein